MNAKKAKALRRAAREEVPSATTSDPADLTREFRCACGAEIPRPSFSATKKLWITGRHYKEVWDWVLVKGTKKPILIGYEVCNAFGQEAPGDSK